MASLRRMVSFYRDQFREMIPWMAVWKEGRGWHIFPMYPEFNDRTSVFTWDGSCDRIDARQILKVDPNAVLLNAYYSNLGDMRTVEDLAQAVARQYEKQYYRLAGAVGDWVDEEEHREDYKGYYGRKEG